MRARRIVLELTQAQYDAMIGAFALAECEWQFTGVADDARRLRPLDRAWSKLLEAWGR